MKQIETKYDTNRHMKTFGNEKDSKDKAQKCANTNNLVSHYCHYQRKKLPLHLHTIFTCYGMKRCYLSFMEGINEFYPSEADHVTTLGIGHTSAHTGSIGNEGATCRGSAFPTNSPG